MRAVDDDGQTVQPGGECLAGVAQVAVQRVVGVDDPSDAGADRPLAGPGLDQLLDAVLGGVVELVPTWPKILMPLSGIGLCDAEIITPNSA